MHEDAELIYRVRELEYALNALKDIAVDGGFWDREGHNVPVPTAFGEFQLNERGRYSFHWFA